jgi:hypothetical protein
MPLSITIIIIITDSFLPSNTATGNRSQMSHISMESLSQMYNQSLRLKFGSAPAELVGKGEHAEKSLEKRIQEIKRQFQSNNLVNSKSQVENRLRSQNRGGDDSASISSSYGRATKESQKNVRVDEKKAKKVVARKTTPKASKANRNEVYSDSSNEEDDEDFIIN